MLSAIALAAGLLGGDGLPPDLLVQDPGVAGSDTGEAAQRPTDEPAAGERPRRGPSRARRTTGDPRVELGVDLWFASLGGRMEKEDAQLGPGSGGNKLSLRTDLDLPGSVRIWRVRLGIIESNEGLEAAQGAWISGELLRTTGRHVLGRGFHHDGVLFSPGALLRTRYQAALLDLDVHADARKRDRADQRYPDGLYGILGLRFAQIDSILESPTDRVSERTAMAWPRVGAAFKLDAGFGVSFDGSAIAGGWWAGDAAQSYAGASVDLEAGFGFAPIPQVQLRIAFRYQNLGMWRERGPNTERMTLERYGAMASLNVRVP